MISNPINELKDDDDTFVPSSDSSFTSNDNNEFNYNIDLCSFIEMQKRYYEEGFTIQTSSDDSSM